MLSNSEDNEKYSDNWGIEIRILGLLPTANSLTNGQTGLTWRLERVKDQRVRPLKKLGTPA